MYILYTVKENIPADSGRGSSGYHSAEITPQPVTAAASSQSSGYGTSETGERPGSRDMVKKSPQTRPDGCGQVVQQDPSKPEPKKTPDKCKLQLECVVYNCV